MDKPSILNLSKKRIIISLITALLFSVMCVVGFQMENRGHLYFSVPVLIAFVCTFVGGAVLVLFLFSVFDRAAAKEKKKVLFPWPYAILISFGVLMILYFIQFLALYPGLFVFDAAWQLDMFRTGQITEHHPVLHTVIMGNVIERFKSDDWHINKGIAAYIIIQMAVSAGCFSYMLSFVYRKTKSILIYSLSTVFMGIFPAIVLQVMSVTKDSLFLAFLILGATLSIEMIMETEDFFSNPVRPILWGAAVLFSMIFRNNCVYAIPFLAIALFVFIRRYKLSFLLLCICTVVLFVFYKLIFVNAFVIEKEDGREMFSVPAQQLAAIYNDGSADIDSEERRIVERLIGKETLNDYVPTMADNTKAGLDMEYFKEDRALVVKTYLSLIGKNPKTAIEGFLSNCLGFWYPGCELTLFDDGRKGYWVVGEYPPAVMNSKLPFLLKYFELFNDSDFVMKNPVTSLLFAPGTFFWLFVLFFAYAIDGKKISYIPVFAFILALWLTYLLGPLAMVRYAIYLYGLVPIYPALVRSEEGSPE